ncbi:isoprenyl transferase [Desemzia sp. C1]|uniref:isoprenyl transferase n=1 Tax=Desemzia sp. C1 TaxID=2892016 RepID=UPI001E3A9B25|nr:isoprenyl transferase [Desemzia sp. C1]MCI3029856.1 isoprenyl transferase [Desemzia sp. C1]
MSDQEREDNQEVYHFLPDESVPNHVAIIMDGNGRWAKNRGFKRSAGHRAGMDQVKIIARHANKRGVKALTVYAFSTENWKRPLDEVNYLMQLPIEFFDEFMPEIMEAGIRVTMIGLHEKLPRKTKKVMERAIKETAHNTGMILNFAVNYGGRNEIVEAAKAMAEDISAGKLKPQKLTEEDFEDYLMTSVLGAYQNVDYMIRTSGEERISNFMLWQNAYSEFYFSSLAWPDFDEKAFDEALAVYQKRQRRFGGL